MKVTEHKIFSLQSHVNYLTDTKTFMKRKGKATMLL